MQLYLDSFSAFLSVKNGQFQVRLASGERHCFAVRSVTAVLLTKGTAMSTDAALLALECDIPVLLIDAQTHFPLGVVNSGRAGTSAAARRSQLVFSRSATGMAWVAGMLSAKIAGQRAVLRGYPHAETDTSDRVMAAMERRLEQWKAPESGDWDDAAHREAGAAFRGWEGTASRAYFGSLALVLPEMWAFQGRQQHPAFDPFNALLSYLYGMLYTTVHLALLKCGLDPHIGVLHADRYGGAPVLAFDLIETYRPWADKVALQLVVSGQISPADFVPDREDRGLWLGPSAKNAAVDAMLAALSAPGDYKGRQVKCSVQIDLAAQALIDRMR